MNRKNTKRALCMSFVSVLLCCSMLVGSTFAWFTDTATTNVNTIQAGTLDVDLVDAAGATLVGQTLQFKKAAGHENEPVLWEPGCTYQLPEVFVKNNGNLHLKYQIVITGINGDAKLNEAIVWTITGTDDGKLAPNGQSNPIKISGHMKEEAGNEYQGLTIDGIAITVNATQVDAEWDSTTDQYDKNAPTLISLKGKSYTTLEAALADAQTGDTVTVGGTVTYDMGNGTGGKDWNGVIIAGNKDTAYPATIEFSGYGSANPLKNAIISDVTIVDNTNSDNDAAWEHGHFEVEDCTFTNVVFADTVLSNGTTKFIDCSFTGEPEMYAAWVNSGTTTFEKCYFTGPRALKVAEMDNSDVVAVTVDDCIFENISKKPGIALDVESGTITIKNSDFINTQPGDQGNYKYESDHNIAITDENNTVSVMVAEGLAYDGEDTYTVTSAAGMYSFAEMVNVDKKNFAGKTVKLGTDVDLENKPWTSIGQTGATQFLGIFDGQGKTISNLNITNTDDSKDCATGLFGWIEKHGTDNLVVKKVKIDGATVTGYHNVGVIAGYLIGTVEECEVTNATVTCTHANDDACGDKAGVIAGIAAETNAVIKSCTAANSAITAGRDAGQIVGACIVGKVENCTATNVTVAPTGDCTGNNINNALIGRTN